MFKRIARDSKYRERPLIEEFKREMDERIRRQLIEAKCSPKSIKQWYERVAGLDRNCRESRREEKRMRSKIEDEEEKKK